MLVLGRRKGDTVLIHGPCKVVVVDTNPLRLGFDAADEVKIVRGELIERVVRVYDTPLVGVAVARDTLVLDFTDVWDFHDLQKAVETLTARQQQAGGSVRLVNPPPCVTL